MPDVIETPFFGGMRQPPPPRETESQEAGAIGAKYCSACRTQQHLPCNLPFIIPRLCGVAEATCPLNTPANCPGTRVIIHKPVVRCSRLPQGRGDVRKILALFRLCNVRSRPRLDPDLTDPKPRPRVCARARGCRIELCQNPL